MTLHKNLAYNTFRNEEERIDSSNILSLHVINLSSDLNLSTLFTFTLYNLRLSTSSGWIRLHSNYHFLLHVLSLLCQCINNYYCNIIINLFKHIKMFNNKCYYWTLVNIKALDLGRHIVQVSSCIITMCESLVSLFTSICHV